MDIAAEQRLVRRGAATAFLLTSAVCAASVVFLPQLIPMPGELAERLAFGVQAGVPHLLCLVVAIRLVSKGRYESAADIGGAAAGPPSPVLAVKAAFLQNTIEQAFVGVWCQLVLASVADGAVLALLPASGLLFAVGRVLFYRRYAGGAGARALGMAMTVLPSLACLGAAGVLATVRLFGW